MFVSKPGVLDTQRTLNTVKLEHDPRWNPNMGQLDPARKLLGRCEQVRGFHAREGDRVIRL